MGSTIAFKPVMEDDLSCLRHQSVNEFDFGKKDVPEGTRVLVIMDCGEDHLPPYIYLLSDFSVTDHSWLKRSFYPYHRNRQDALAHMPEDVVAICSAGHPRVYEEGQASDLERITGITANHRINWTAEGLEILPNMFKIGHSMNYHEPGVGINTFAMVQIIVLS